MFDLDLLGPASAVVLIMAMGLAAVDTDATLPARVLVGDSGAEREARESEVSVGVLPLALALPDTDERDLYVRTEGVLFFVAPSEEGYINVDAPSISAFRALALSRCAAVGGFFWLSRVETADMYRLEQPLILASLLFYSAYACLSCVSDRRPPAWSCNDRVFTRGEYPEHSVLRHPMCIWAGVGEFHLAIP